MPEGFAWWKAASWAHAWALEAFGGHFRPLKGGLRASEGSCDGPNEEEWGPGDSFASEWPKTAAG